MEMPEKLSEFCVGCRRVLDLSKAPPDWVGETLCPECFPDMKWESRLPLKDST
jgi:hypothetical protein